MNNKNKEKLERLKNRLRKSEESGLIGFDFDEMMTEIKDEEIKLLELRKLILESKASGTSNYSFEELMAELDNDLKNKKIN